MKNLRRMPLVLAIVAVLVVAAIGWLIPSSRNSQAAPAPSSDGAFKGKVLLVSTSNMMSNFLLEKALVQKIGDRSFLVGKGAAESRMGGWYKDRTVRLEMCHIVSITEFDDVKEAAKALQSGGGGMPFGIGGYGVTAPADGPATPPPGAPLPPSRQ